MDVANTLAHYDHKLRPYKVFVMDLQPYKNKLSRTIEHFMIACMEETPQLILLVKQYRAVIIF
jgi:hypothetical protein